MRLRLAVLFVGLSLICPSLLRADTVYTLNVEEDNIAAFSIHLQFDVPSILTVATTGITSFTATLGSGFNGCTPTSVAVTNPSAPTDIEMDLNFAPSPSCNIVLASGDFNTPITSLGTYNAFNDFSFKEIIGTLGIANSSPVPTPEPASMLLLGSGLLSIMGAGWRRKSRINGSTAE
jgi:hypothetical protein